MAASVGPMPGRGGHCRAAAGRWTAERGRWWVRPYALYLPWVARRARGAGAGPGQARRLFTPHPQLIVRRQTGNLVLCGRQVGLEDGDGGMISGYWLHATTGRPALM